MNSKNIAVYLHFSRSFFISVYNFQCLVVPESCGVILKHKNYVKCDLIRPNLTIANNKKKRKVQL